MFPIASNSDDETLYSDSVFSTTLYTGNGSTQTITNGIDLAGKGGLVWIKSRSTDATYGGAHQLVDTARGLTASSGSSVLATDIADSSSGSNGYSAANQGFASFNAAGFSLNAVAAAVYSGSTNTNNVTYASWTFRKAAKFFDVVTYTGTGSARTIAHSLGVAPGMVIVKRTDTTGDWQVYHRGLTSAANSIQLNLTAVQASEPTVWNSTAPTSSVFSVGTSADVNASGGTYVAYLYAHDTSSTGIIQCGSYTGTSVAGNVVTLGFEPQWLLIKKVTSTAAGWFILDVMRGMTSDGNDYFLYANTSDAESTTLNVSPNATGFTLVNTSGSFNASGATYIYMAIRRPNKPPTTGTQVYSPISVTNSIGTDNTTGFAVDLQMNTLRSAAGKLFVDRLRGVSTTTTSTGIYLNSTNANAEASGGIMTRNWGNTGFQTSDEYGSLSTIYWNFKRAPGFFDEVCYTGTGVATTQAHNLGVAPELMIIKSRTNAFGWSVYNISLGVASAIYLNSTSAAGGSPEWNSTTPTSNVFSISNAVTVNGSGQTYVAYLFATLAGISKVGSYTGNGSSQNIECGFAAGARFVLVKATSTTGDWLVADTARGIVSGNDPRLSLNSTAAEVTGEDWLDPYAPGFTVNQTTASANASGVSYIFLAIS